MAIRLPDGSIQMSDGRIVYANSLILGADLCEIVPLCVPPPAWPFVSGGGGGGPGPQGPAGPAGTGGGGGGGAGTQGQQGFQGTNPGVQGPQGNQGNLGVQGSQGLRGFQGFQGFQGSVGTQGLQGFQGLTGAGLQGPQGFQGINGLQGLQGFQGNQGPSQAGVQGPQGFQNAAGAQGNQGFQGASGSGGALFQNVQENTLTTVDATPTVILSETIPAASVATFRVVVDARYDDGSLHASFVRTIRANREGGGALLGTENADYTDDESLALTATFTASGNDVQVTVIGVAATSITWKARMGRVILP